MKNKFSFYKNYIFFLKYKILFIAISCSNKKFWLFFFFSSRYCSFQSSKSVANSTNISAGPWTIFYTTSFFCFILQLGIHSLFFFFLPQIFMLAHWNKSSRLDTLTYLKYFRGQGSFEAQKHITLWIKDNVA